MGMMSRRKGAAGEREAAEKLNEVLGTRFRRGRQYCGGPESPDLAGDLPGLHLEVKRVEALRLYPSLEQARRDAATDQVSAVMHRSNRKPWAVIVYADDLIRLLDVVDAARARAGWEACSAAHTAKNEKKGLEFIKRACGVRVPGLSFLGRDSAAAARREGA